MTKNFSIPVPVVADTPADLFVEVQKKISVGYDLHAPTVPLLGKLVTWMVEYPTIYTYVLVNRESLDDFALNVQSLSAKGYDQVFPAFEFKGFACQWMAKEQPSSYAEVFRMPMSVTQTEPVVLSGFNLVAGVHVLGRLSSLNFLHPLGYKPGGSR